MVHALMTDDTDRPDQTPWSDEAAAAGALLGAGLPPEAEHHLVLAGQNYHRDDIAEQHLKAAQDSAPDHAAVLIGQYRFYFYKGCLREALYVAQLCLKKAARESGLPENWRDVSAAEANFSAYEEMLPRFYLFTLKAYGYLQMRLGNLEEGGAIVRKLLELDASDKIGARVLLDVLNRVGQDHDDEL